MSNSSLESDVKVPAPLHLPFGKLFFGFKVTAYKAPPSDASPASPGVAAAVSLDILFVVLFWAEGIHSPLLLVAQATHSTGGLFSLSPSLRHPRPKVKAKRKQPRRMTKRKSSGVQAARRSALVQRTFRLVFGHAM